jgi:hypothetical protein
VNLLHEVAEAAGPALDGHAVADPGEPRFALDDPVRAFVLEAVYEGYLMHYGTPRLFEATDDDLRLLAGDALYALGLSRLAEAGDLEAVTELSGLISRSAQAHAEGRGEDAEAMWEDSARALAGPR